jgi:carbonic anhydrase/acetyltransferase-like protein (isoleucine patch superfamily)
MALVIPFDGHAPAIAPDAFVAPNATLIGHVVIAAGASVWFNCVLRGDTNLIRLGARSNLQDGTVIHVAREGSGTVIGEDVVVGHMAMLHACTIESGALIGMTACLLDDVVVEAGAMVAAGALVTPGKRVGAGELWSGRPARFARRLTPEERAEMAWGAAHYCELAALYRALPTA